MKKILYILGTLIGLAVIAVVVLIFSLGSIVKTGVNRYGPQITQSTVVLKDARISPLSGVGTLKELTVGNPAGWQTPQAFFLKEITLEVEPRSLTTEHIVINRILIDQPVITYETTITNSNLQDLLNNIQKTAAGEKPTAPSTQPQTQPQPEAKPTKQVKIEIKSFRFQNGTIHLTGAGNNLTVPMPELVMENLGTREGGLTPEELTSVIVKEITAQVGKAALNAAAKKGLFDKAGEGLKGLLGGK